MLPQHRIETFKEFWPYYVMEHSKKGTRILHFIGTSLAFACLILFFLKQDWRFFLLGLFVGYLFAWLGHFLVEKNRPATFKYPLWSFLGDWKMWIFTLVGKMRGELERAGSQRH